MRVEGEPIVVRAWGVPRIDYEDEDEIREDVDDMGGRKLLAGGSSIGMTDRGVASLYVAGISFNRSL
jgi:hypothetical protein